MNNMKKMKVNGSTGQLGFVFFMAYVGSVVYFVNQTSGSFLDVLWALIKSIAWPAFLVYHAMQGMGV